jgi:hypothetical protein
MNPLEPTRSRLSCPLLMSMYFINLWKKNSLHCNKGSNTSLFMSPSSDSSFLQSHDSVTKQIKQDGFSLLWFPVIRSLIWLLTSWSPINWISRLGWKEIKGWKGGFMEEKEELHEWSHSRKGKMYVRWNCVEGNFYEEVLLWKVNILLYDIKHYSMWFASSD